jgi:hypothetical protein
VPVSGRSRSPASAGRSSALARPRRAAALPLVVCAFALAACGGDDAGGGGAGGAGGGGDAGGELVVDLVELSASGQTGTATFTPSSDGTLVTVETVSYLVDPQPASVRKGTCADPGTLAYELATIEDGISVTTLDVELGALREGGYAVVVAKSRARPDERVACGQIG